MPTDREEYAAAAAARDLGLPPVSRFEEAVGLVRELVIARDAIQGHGGGPEFGYAVLEESAARARTFLAKIDGGESGGDRDGK